MAHLFDEPGSNVTIKWQSEPEFRGTFTILSTCLITLALSVWSAVHLNVPGNPKSFSEAFLRRLAWISCSLFIPELLILVAWSQRQAAKRVGRKFEETFKATGFESDPEAHTHLSRNPWTMTHSFWSIMGGLAIDVNGSEPLVPGENPPKLTENGIMLLLALEPDLIPDISEDELKDKRKANSLTKLIACAQATWFCASCIARVAQRLPISLFELNTFAHAFCTVIIYTIWWKKPLDIERPLLITHERIRPLMAYMWMASKTSARSKIKRNDDTTYKVGQDPEFEAISYDSKRRANFALRAETTSQSPTVEVNTRQGLPGTKFYVNEKSTRWVVTSTTTTGDDMNARSDSYTYREPAIFNLTPLDVRRWTLAQHALEKYNLTKPNKNLDLVTVKPVPELFDFHGGLNNSTPQSWPRLGFSVLAVFYGGLHALGWNAKFPMHRELVFWRVSAIAIASPAVLLLLYVMSRMLVQYSRCLMAYVSKARSSATQPPLQTLDPAGTHSAAKNMADVPDPATTPENCLITRAIGICILTIAMTGFFWVYAPARVYIVVESFRTVFYLPPGAFKTTSWSQYFPHIT